VASTVWGNTVRIKVALALMALAMGTGACGGGTEDGSQAAVSETPNSTASRSVQGGGARGGRAGGAGGAASCEAKRITTPPYREGTCIQGRARVVVVDGLSRLRLKSLHASLKGFALLDVAGGRGVEESPRRGAFIRITLEVQNRTKKPQRFEAGQTLLLVAGKEYEESAQVERAIQQTALAYGQRKLIPPGASATGDVLFDVPLEEVERVTAQGLLLIANFRGTVEGRLPEIGQVRIYQR
jgi:hypothetical protein